MHSCSNSAMSSIALFFVTICVLFRASHLLLPVVRLMKSSRSGWAKPVAVPETKSAPSDKKVHLVTPRVDAKELLMYKTLYHKLQNLERYPEILEEARDLLIFLFAEKLSEAEGTNDGILSLPTFDAGKLAEMLKAQDKSITDRWESYVAARDSGGPRQMFKDLDHAKWWLKQISPVKFVDGAWLGHIHKITTPFALRSITKKAWQVMSEELGDGDVTKNHVYLWNELMKDIDAGLPAPDSKDFIHPRHGLDKPHVWKAAVAQLLISIFPHEFLPEILGFNMHFEMLTWDTMRAIKELKELKLNDYYFLLHVSIDNADSGHTAMAMQAVVDYMTHVQNTFDDATVQQTWKRVQAGFILSERLPTSPDVEPIGPAAHFTSSSSAHEGRVLEIFRAKAAVSHKLHCASKVKINGRKLVDWLNPVSFESEAWRKEFIRSLASSKAWVKKGNSAGSRLMNLLRWDGKMFGSFTDAEVETVRTWIDSLSDGPDPNVYWNFVQRLKVPSSQALANLDIARDYPVFSTSVSVDHSAQQPLSLAELHAPVDDFVDIDLEKLVPIWFACASLLEGFVTTPARTMTKCSSAIVQVLRAQYGFGTEGEGVAGTDEYKRQDCIDVVDIGCEMMSKIGWPVPTCLGDVLEDHLSDDIENIMSLSMRPTEHREALLGMSWAFAGLHEFLATSDRIDVLSESTRIALPDMAVREKAGLRTCLLEISDDEVGFVRFSTGYRLARQIFTTCRGGQ